MRSLQANQGRGLRFPCNGRTDEVNKLFIIWPLSTIQKKSIIKGKNTGGKTRSLWLSSSLILKKYRYAYIFLSVIEKIVIFYRHFLLFFAPSLVAFTHNSKNRRAEKKLHNARSLQENNARSAANQSARTIVDI